MSENEAKTEWGVEYDDWEERTGRGVIPYPTRLGAERSATREGDRIVSRDVTPWRNVDAVSPTKGDADRDAMAVIILQWMEAADEAGIDGPHSADVADALYAAGFRRSRPEEVEVVRPETVKARAWEEGAKYAWMEGVRRLQGDSVYEAVVGFPILDWAPLSVRNANPYRSDPDAAPAQPSAGQLLDEMFAEAKRLMAEGKKP